MYKYLVTYIGGLDHSGKPIYNERQLTAREARVDYDTLNNFRDILRQRDGYDTIVFLNVIPMPVIHHGHTD